MNMGFAGGGGVIPPPQTTQAAPGVFEFETGGRSIDYIEERNKLIRQDDEEILVLIKIFTKWL